MGEAVSSDVLGLTVRIVAAHIGHNQVPTDALPGLIQAVYRSLATADAPEITPAAASIPAVPVKRSVFPDFLVCLEDGMKLKMLRRHLQTSYGMTPADYRTKWGLPPDYPMVAPNYAATRSTLAKSIGLGRKRAADASQIEATLPEEQEVTMVPARRARGSRG